MAPLSFLVYISEPVPVLGPVRLRCVPPDLAVAHRLRYRTERTQGQALRLIQTQDECTVADSAPTL
jgi:hypothetical protein